MAKVDVKWLNSVARDDNAKHWIRRICQWREHVLRYNEFIKDHRSFILQLGDYSLRFNADSSDLPGDIVELGVYRGASLMSWANFLEIRNMGDRQVFGFDNSAGFTSFDEKDGRQDSKVSKVASGYDSSVFEEILKDAVSIYDRDRFIPYKPRVILVKGNYEKRKL